MDTFWLVVLALWALFGIPIGTTAYRQYRQEGVPATAALVMAMARGIVGPVELLWNLIRSIFERGKK